MILWRRVPAWLFQAWPVLALLPFFALHAWALHYFFGKTATVNKIVGMLLQVLGGLLILYSINENLGLFRKQSIFSTFLAWLREFPLTRKTIILAGVGSASGASSGTGVVSVQRAPLSIEERVADLESKLHDFQAHIRNELNVVQSRIEAAKTELSSCIDATNATITQLSQQVESATVGGFKLQAFGVLLALYGAITSVFA